MKTRSRTRSSGDARRGRRKWPPEVRLQTAQAIVDRGVSKTAVSQTLGIPVTTVSEWARRYRKYGTDIRRWAEEGTRAPQAREARPREADPRRAAVIESRREHPEHGTRRIRDLLARFEGLGVSETTVRRILHEEGLLESVPAKVEKPGPPEHRFERAEPNQLWQSDIFTFLLRRHQRLYVTAFMDDCSRYVVSLVVAHHQRSSLVMEALSRGIAEHGIPREVLTDQGRQYTAWRGHTDFEAELKRQGIHHIKSRPHHPQTLGKIERFWKTLWDELLSRTVFADFDDCQRRMALFVQAYNFRRPHQGIQGMVPADRFFRAAPHVRAVIEKGVAENALALAQEQPRRKPFYLVGRFGERDLTIALSGKGLMVRLGDVEETIPLRGEESDEKTPAPARVTEAEAASDSEMDHDIEGPGQSRAAEVPHGLERALGGDAGDRGDLAGGHLAGHVLPAGDARAERDAEGARTPGGGGRDGELASETNRGAGGEGERAGTLAAPDAEAAPHDEASGAGQGEENQLDAAWQRSFAGLEDEEASEEGRGPEPAFDSGDDWRGRALGWERKLSGADEASHGEEDLHGDADHAGGDRPPLRDGDGGALGGAERQRGSEEAGALPESFPEPDAPHAGRDDREPGAPSGGTAGHPGAGEASAARDGEAGSGEREASAPSGNDGSDPGRGEWPAAGPHRSGEPR